MSDQDQNPNGNGEGTKTPEGTAGEGVAKKEAPEGFVPKEQFAASQAEAIKLAKENEALRKGTPPKDGKLPEDKQKVFSAIEEYEKKKAEDAKKADEALKSSLDKLHTIHGDFDDKKLISIVDEYGIFTDDGSVKWEKAIELYKKLGNQVVKKPDIGGRTQDKPLEADKVEVRGKNHYDLITEGLKRFGIGRE
jgi:hypothetical protein